MELNSDSLVGQEHINITVKFSINLNIVGGPVDVKKYVLVFFHKFLSQREQMHLGELRYYLEPKLLGAVSSSNCFVQPSVQHRNFRVVLGLKL